MLFRKTIDGEVAAFTKAIANLEEIADRETDESVRKNEQALTLRQEADAHLREASRAGTIAEKLRGIVG